MMKSLLPSRSSVEYASVAWHRSTTMSQVSFAIRRASLAQRIELTAKARELTLKHEFLRAGDVTDQLAASLSELMVRRLYLEWGLVNIRGLKIDGSVANVGNLIEFGPEELVDEIIERIKAELGLTDAERKNS